MNFHLKSFKAVYFLNMYIFIHFGYITQSRLKKEKKKKLLKLHLVQQHSCSIGRPSGLNISGRESTDESEKSLKVRTLGCTKYYGRVGL